MEGGGVSDGSVMGNLFYNRTAGCDKSPQMCEAAFREGNRQTGTLSAESNSWQIAPFSGAFFF